MANKNGLVGGIPVYKDGTRPCWVSAQNSQSTSFTATDGVDSCTMTPAGLTLQQNSGAFTGFVNMDNGGNIVITPDPAGQVRMFPAGSGGGAITIDASGVDLVTIAPFDSSQTQIVCQSMPGYRAITGTGGSGVGMGEENCGVVNWVTVTTTGGFTLQVAGGGLIAGTTLLFAFNPASFAGATVNITNNSTVLATFTPSSATAGRALEARVFTPDGTNWFVLS